MNNSLEYEGFILDIQVHSDDYLIGNIRKNKYFSVSEGIRYDVSGKSVKEIREEFEKYVDNRLREYVQKAKELEETNTTIITYKDFDLRVIKNSSGKLVGKLVGANTFAPKFKSKNIETIRVAFERYIDNLLFHVSVYSDLITYRDSKKMKDMESKSEQFLDEREADYYDSAYQRVEELMYDQY